MLLGPESHDEVQLEPASLLGAVEQAPHLGLPLARLVAAARTGLLREAGGTRPHAGAGGEQSTCRGHEGGDLVSVNVHRGEGGGPGEQGGSRATCRDAPSMVQARASILDTMLLMFSTLLVIYR